MNRNTFDAWFDENIQKWIEVQVSKSNDDVVDPDPIFIEEDTIGILFASDFFHYVASFLSDAKHEMDVFDNKMSLSHAYSMLEFSIDWLMDNDILGDDWAEVANLFSQRANEFIDAPEYDVVGLSGDLSKISGALDQLVHSYTIKEEAYSRDGDFSSAEKIQFIRSTLLTFRNKGMLDYTWPWFKELIASLDVDWRIMGGGFPTTIDPTYKPPWSHG
jgi:hypothetical protein